MGRPAKPNHLKLINGSAKHNPDRHRDDHLIPEPKKLDVGNPPRYFNKELKKVWREVKKIIPDGVAGDSDRISFEMLCLVIYRIRTSDDFVASHFQQYIALSSRFGLTPSDRQKVKIPEPKKKSGFDNV